MRSLIRAGGQIPAYGLHGNLVAVAGSHTGTTLDRTVAKLNIEHYRRLLAAETDETRRQVLLKLLGEEEKKLADSEGNPPKPKPVAR